MAMLPGTRCSGPFSRTPCASSCSSPYREEEGSFYSNGETRRNRAVLKKGKTRASEELAMDKKWLLSLLTSRSHPSRSVPLQVLGVSGTPCL